MDKSKDNNFGMRAISFFHDRRMIKHIIFWVSILAFFTVLRAFERGLKIVLINNFLYLLIDIPIVYIILYYLWPRFFVKDRILSFIASVLILYTGAIFYSRLINYYINPLLGYHVEKGSLIEDAMYSMIVLGFISVLALVFKLLDEKYLFSIREEEYKKLRAEAELKLLRFQINPHFLFNSLSSVQGLMYHDARMADKMLTELSEFLRYTLAYTELVFVPLDKEIEIIKKYLNIEKVRFGENLYSTFNITRSTLDKEVLGFILQPLVENAIKHGIKTNPGGLKINIRTEMISSWLKMEIINTGSYNPDEVNIGTGIRNIRKRLENAYPGSHEFEIIQENNRVHAIIKIKIIE